MGTVVKRLVLRLAERTVDVRIEGDQTVRIDDAKFQVEPIGRGVYRVRAADGQWTVAVAADEGARWVWVDGQVATFEVGEDDGQTRGRRKATDHELAAPMPATVIRVLVAPGSTVRSGEALLVLEAMKMELSIRAPRDGVVRSIHCEAGDLVPPGVNLLDLEP